ncbi:hypothetical protein ACFLW5_02160, partial [Chloroflexota bacterium]
MKIIPMDTHHVEHPFQGEMLKKLWEPITIAGVTSKNRIAFAPTGNTPPHVYPEMPESNILFNEALAKGGTGIIVIGEAVTTPDSPESDPLKEYDSGNSKGIWSDDQIPGWAKLIDTCHKWGATVFPQLSWSDPWLGTHRRPKSKIVTASWEEAGLTPEAPEVAKKNFVAGALRAKKAGADGVEIHGMGTREVFADILVSGEKGDLGSEQRVRLIRESISAIKAA